MEHYLSKFFCELEALCRRYPAIRIFPPTRDVCSDAITISMRLHPPPLRKYETVVELLPLEKPQEEKDG